MGEVDRARVGARQMPPWHIDKTVGIQKFKNDRSLSDDQIETILRVGGRRRAEGRSEGHAGAEGLEGRVGLEHGEQVRRSRTSS